jgi:hypothetical protein
MRLALFAFALACAPACQLVALHFDRATHFDFEADPIGAAPEELVSSGTGWNARIESGQAATGRRSVRLFAEDEIERSRCGDLSVCYDARSFRKRIVRVSASMRVEDGSQSTSTMRLFIDVKRKDGTTVLSDSMDDAPVMASAWTPVEITAAIADDADTITFGARVDGPGPFHLDDLSIESVRKLSAEDSKLLEVASERQLANPAVQTMHLRSELLSRFFGRDMFIDAGVIVPPSPLPADLAACYQIEDTDGSWACVYSEGAAVANAMRHRYPQMLYVYLDGGGPQGHHVFADSVNEGPWAEALVNELIPAIESRFLSGRAPRCRFVTGHGSGGWSAVWLQTTYPHFFNGAWATAPDPMEFKDFEGTDIYGPCARRGTSADDESRTRIAELESQFSPRGNDGRPMQLFDKHSGGVDPIVALAWRKFDIDAILSERWDVLGPKLTGRIHIWCGAHDTAARLTSVRVLDQDLTKLRANADVLIVGERDHQNLSDPHPIWWPLGMKTRIHREMAQQTAGRARP